MKWLKARDWLKVSWLWVRAIWMIRQCGVMIEYGHVVLCWGDVAISFDKFQIVVIPYIYNYIYICSKLAIYIYNSIVHIYIVLDIGLQETHFYTFVQSKCISIAPLNFSLSYSTGPTFGEALTKMSKRVSKYLCEHMFLTMRVWWTKLFFVPLLSI